MRSPISNPARGLLLDLHYILFNDMYITYSSLNLNLCLHHEAHSSSIRIYHTLSLLEALILQIQVFNFKLPSFGIKSKTNVSATRGTQLCARLKRGTQLCAWLNWLQVGNHLKIFFKETKSWHATKIIKSIIYSQINKQFCQKLQILWLNLRIIIWSFKQNNDRNFQMCLNLVPSKL